MTKYLKIALFLIAAVIAPLVAIAGGALWLLFAAPTVFGVLLVTGATLFMLKNVVLAVTAFLISVAAVVIFNSNKSKVQVLPKEGVCPTEG